MPDTALDVINELTWSHGARPVLNRARDALSVPDGVRIGPDLAAAFDRHHDELLRNELYFDGISRFHRFMVERHGADPAGRAVADSLAALGDNGTLGALNEAYVEQDLEGYKTALNDYLREGARAFRKTLTLHTTAHKTSGVVNAPGRERRNEPPARTIR